MKIENEYGSICRNETWITCTHNPRGFSFKYLNNGETNSIESRIPPNPFQIYGNPLLFNKGKIRSTEELTEIARDMRGEMIFVENAYDLIQTGHYNELMFLQLMLSKRNVPIGEVSRSGELRLPRGYLLDINGIELEEDIDKLPSWVNESELLVNKALRTKTSNLTLDFQLGLCEIPQINFWDQERKSSQKISIPVYDVLLIRNLDL